MQAAFECSTQFGFRMIYGSAAAVSNSTSYSNGSDAIVVMSMLATDAIIQVRL
jgi:hypothetical protein